MSSRIDWYLIELDRQLSDFPEERRQILLTEVESHLRDQTDEMVAAGMALAEADSEAVRVFGEPGQFAARLRDETGCPAPRAESEAKLRGTGLAIGGAVGTLMVLAFAMSLVTPGTADLLAYFLVVCVAIVLVTAFCSRRVTLGSMLATICFGGLATALTLGVAFVDFGPLDAEDVHPVTMAQVVVVDPSVEVPYNALPEPGRSGEAQAALAVPIPMRAQGFLPTAILAASCAAALQFVVWLFRYSVRLVRRIRRRATA
jgi:uncharacterized membrane protein